MPNDPTPVIVNRHGGAASSAGDRLKDDIEAAFKEVGLAADVLLLDAEDIAATVRELADRPLVVIGGGDGTIGCAAQARAESGDGALGLLPLGTLNHFAKELGVGADLKAAAATIAAGYRRRVDLAEVNGRVFINNASLGIYPAMVRKRDATRWPKWLATVPAAWNALSRLPSHRLYLDMDGISQPVRTALLFVGNNDYSLEGGEVGRRKAIDGGKLSVFAVAAQSRTGLVATALRILAGRGDPERDFAAIGEACELVVRTRAGAIDVAADGEVMRLSTPLTFRIRPRALTVVAPPG